MVLILFVESGLQFDVVMAMDVNTNANLVYRHNFPEVDVNASAIEVNQLQNIRYMYMNNFMYRFCDNLITGT